jgi:copper chaperone CopZ
MKKIINVDGMTCDHCVSTIKQALENQVGIVNVEVEIKKTRSL